MSADLKDVWHPGRRPGPRILVPSAGSGRVLAPRCSRLAVRVAEQRSRSITVVAVLLLLLLLLLLLYVCTTYHAPCPRTCAGARYIVGACKQARLPARAGPPTLRLNIENAP